MTSCSTYKAAEVQALEALQGWCATLDDECHVYALVDMAGLGDEKAAIKALGSLKLGGAISILGDARPQAARAMPWLLPTNHRVDGRWLARSAAWAVAGPCLTWLASPLLLGDMAARLASRTDATLPDSYDVLMRYFDPRVLPVLHQVLSSEQASTYWAFGHSWAYLDRTMQLKSLDLMPAAQRDPFNPPLELDQEQFGALLSASEVDQVMPELVHEAPTVFLAIPASERLPFTQRCLALADQWKVERFAHRVMICVLALKLGEDFHLQKNWHPWIEQLRQGKLDLVAVIKKATSS